MMDRVEEMEWALEQFGGAQLGDARRTTRLVRIAAFAARSPAGTVTAVFDDDAELQGAYDFLESPHIEAAALELGVGQAAAQSCGRESHVFAAVDGSSLTFVDRTGERGLGAVGSYSAGARGLKVITSLAISNTGVPLGILRQVTWRRPAERPTNRRSPQKRPVAKKETRHWIEAVRASSERMAATGAATRITFLIDREGDSAAMLTTLAPLAQSGHGFIVRGNWDREVAAEDGRCRKVRNLLVYQPVLGAYDLEVCARPGRSARVAHIELTSAQVVLTVQDPASHRVVDMKLTAVRAMETGAVPKGEEPIDWLLLTTMPARTEQEARAVVRAYTYRWRIEEFHRAWKSGRCNVEDSQLRSMEALQKWALVLATVAVRIERLKRLSRDDPDAPATMAFSESEIHAIIILKRRNGRKIPNGIPTMRQATTWLAELGGYTGRSSGGPPGTVTIARGLLRVRAAADAIEALTMDEEKR
jgi:hypothetical protein